MKHTIRRIGAAVLALAVLLSIGLAASAAPVPEATIDTGRTGSIEIYKYDMTKANEDGSVREILDSYVSTGIRDEELENALDDGTFSGRTSYGCAVCGVEFSLMKVADIVSCSETGTDGTHGTRVLYRMEDAVAAPFLSAIGLTAEDAYEGTGEAEQEGSHCYLSDTLTEALRKALEKDPVAVKNALEAFMADGNAEAFEATDGHGHTAKTDLPLGLYLIVETKVPETVTCTTDPFLVSVPMTAVNGTNAENGGEAWIYDITLYPKNETGEPTLEKTVREARRDTGRNGGTEDIRDGYSHNATASCGDILEYQIVSRLPAVTSNATALTEYTFTDDLCAGLSYNGDPDAEEVLMGNYDAGDVRIGWYGDEACTEQIAAWTLSDAEPKYSVAYENWPEGGTTMTVSMTEAGMDEINRSYSSCWIRVTYSATLDRSADVVYGDESNWNSATLSWKRSQTEEWDMLFDDCHVYTYVLDLTKEFSDGAGDLTKVKFKLFNATDGYWVTAVRSGDGVYYVQGEDRAAGHVAGSADEDGAKGTALVPDSTTGRLLVYGLEDDEYIVTETATDSGYTLLKEDIRVTITAEEDPDRPCGDFGGGLVCLAKGDPQDEASDGPDTTGHVLLTASATVDGDTVAMEPENYSEDARVPLTVVNTRGFDLPRTGDSGVWQYSLAGLVLMAAAAAVIVVLLRTKKNGKAK